MEDGLDIEVEIPKSYIPPTLAWYGLICEMVMKYALEVVPRAEAWKRTTSLPLQCSTCHGLCFAHEWSCRGLKVDSDGYDTAHAYVASDYFLDILDANLLLQSICV